MIQNKRYLFHNSSMAKLCREAARFHLALKTLVIALFMVLFFSADTLLAQAQDKQLPPAEHKNDLTLSLTPEERDWLANHAKIELGFTDAFEPAVIVNEDGSYRGTLVDILARLNQLLGTDIKLTVGPIPDVISQVSRKEIAGILALHPQYADKLGFLKTRVYMNSYPTIFTRAGSTFTTPSDLAGKKIALIDKVFFSQALVDLHGAGSTLIKVRNGLEGLKCVKDGSADLYIGSSRNSYLLSKYQFFDLVAAFQFFDRPTPNVIAVRNDWPQLVSILNKGLAAIPAEEVDAIRRKWLSVAEKNIRDEFTAEENDWLKQNHTVRVYLADWPPYLMINENQPPEGISIEYLKLIGKRTGINFEYQVTGQPFAEFLESMKQGQGPDMTPVIAQSSDREQYISFTNPYIYAPWVFFAREQQEVLQDISALNGKTVAVPRSYIMQQLLEKDYPQIRLLLFDNDEQALFAVSSGKADAYVGHLTVASHFINRHGLSNLRVVASTPYGVQVLSMGNRSDWPELTSIINKALASITEEEKTAIRNKYMAVQYQQGIDRAEVIKWVLILAGVATATVLLFTTWNWQLRRKVGARTAELEMEIVERKHVEDALRVSEEEYRSLVEQSPFSVQICNPDGKITRVNQAWMDLWGIAEDAVQEVLEKYNILEDEESRKRGVMPLIEQAFEGHNVLLPVVEYDVSNTLKDLKVAASQGNKRYVQLRMYPVRNSQGTLIKVVGIADNLTEQKLAEAAAHQSFDYLQHVTSTLAGAIFSVKMPDRIIEWANDSYHVLGYAPEECIGQTTEKFYNNHEDYQNFGVLLMNAIQSGEQIFTAELWLCRKNGEMFPAEIASTVYRINGEVVSVTALVRDITKRKQAEEKIERYQDRLKSLASQVAIIDQAERRRIAAGLHDHIGQTLAFSRLQLARAKKQADDDDQHTLLDDISQSLLQVIEDTKELIFDLSSPLLDEIGLDAAITDWLENQVKRKYGLEYSYRQEGAAAELNELERTILFRNFKELVVNVVKHAQASRIDVRLGENEETFFLAVSDNGLGFDPEQLEIKTSIQGGFGFFSIQERMADIGGTFAIDSETGKGCTITMRLPVDSNNVETTK